MGATSFFTPCCFCCRDLFTLFIFQKVVCAPFFFFEFLPAAPHTARSVVVFGGVEQARNKPCMTNEVWTTKWLRKPAHICRRRVHPTKITWVDCAERELLLLVFVGLPGHGDVDGVFWGNRGNVGDAFLYRPKISKTSRKLGKNQPIFAPSLVHTVLLRAEVSTLPEQVPVVYMYKRAPRLGV